MKKWTILLLILAFGCAKKDKNTLKIAASPVPHAQMLTFIKPTLKEQKVDLKIIEVDDYNIPNRSLAEKEVDANFFQHIPFMENQIKTFGYPITCFAKIHLEPMGIYSKKYTSLKDIPMGATIAVPNDPTNEYRALAILEKEGLVTLRQNASLQATKADIVHNPKKLKFFEIESAMLPRTLQDVEAAAIPTNYALQAQLNPLKDALAIEGEDSPYVNIIAIRDGEENNPKLDLLKKAMLSKEMHDYILKQYKGAILPILKECK